MLEDANILSTFSDYDDDSIDKTAHEPDELLLTFYKYEELPISCGKLSTLLNRRKKDDKRSFQPILDGSANAFTIAFSIWNRMYEKLCFVWQMRKELKAQKKSLTTRLNKLEKRERQHFVTHHLFTKESVQENPYEEEMDNTTSDEKKTDSIPKRQWLKLPKDFNSHKFYRKMVEDQTSCSWKSKTNQILHTMWRKELEDHVAARRNFDEAEEILRIEERIFQICTENCPGQTNFKQTKNLPKLSENLVDNVLNYLNPTLASSVCSSWNERIKTMDSRVFAERVAFLKFDDFNVDNDLFPGDARMWFPRFDIRQLQKSRRAYLKERKDAYRRANHFSRPSLLSDLKFPKQDCRYNFSRIALLLEPHYSDVVLIRSIMYGEEHFLNPIDHLKEIIYLQPTRVIFRDPVTTISGLLAKLPEWWWTDIEELHLLDITIVALEEIIEAMTKMNISVLEIEDKHASIKSEEFSKLVKAMTSVKIFKANTGWIFCGEILSAITDKSNLSKTGLSSLQIEGFIYVSHLRYFIENVKLEDDAKILLVVYGTMNDWQDFRNDQEEFKNGSTTEKLWYKRFSNEFRLDPCCQVYCNTIRGMRCFVDIDFYEKLEEFSL